LEICPNDSGRIPNRIKVNKIIFLCMLSIIHTPIIVRSLI
jgi:hypothetical protein